MKLSELLIDQNLIVQFIWGEQKIEFTSLVVGVDGVSVLITPYVHNGSELELNVSTSKGVVCNIFTDEPNTGERISWKNVELSTVNKNNQILYAVKTNVFNHDSKRDDRRLHERVIIHIKGYVSDGKSNENTEIMVHDISDVGISFYAPLSYVPKTTQVVVSFTDNIDEEIFHVRVEGSITRTTTKAGNKFVACKILGENKDYQIYGFMKRLLVKNK